MKSFKSLNFKEKMEYIGILAIYPLILLYEQIGKSFKFLNSKSRQITASILTVCLMLTMIPVMSLTAFATTSHTHDEVTFEPWTATDSLPTTSGNYYLVNDVALGNFYDIPENVDITLCLNDKVVTVTNYIYNICITSQGRLTIYDCGNTVRSYTENEFFYYWELDEVFDNTETVKLTTGGIITGMTYNRCIDNAGTLTINGGNIVGNCYNSYSGGGIQNNGTLTINGGHILGNSTSNYYGGGISNAGTFTMTGGEIAYNFSDGVGAGIHNWEGTVAISGGIIHNNNVDENISNDAGELTDLLADGYAFYDKDGNAIKSTDLANAEYLEVKEVTPPHNHDGVEGEFTELTDWAQLATSGKYYLGDTIPAVSGNIEIASGANITLCLNGKTLDIGNSNIKVAAGGVLNVCDCGTQGKITGSASSDYLIDNEGSLTAENVTIENTGSDYVIYNYGAILNLTDCDITAEYGVFVTRSAANILNSNVRVSANSYAIILSTSDAIVNIDGGTIVSEQAIAVNATQGSLYLAGDASILSNTDGKAGILRSTMGSSYNGKIYAHAYGDPSNVFSGSTTLTTSSSSLSTTEKKGFVFVYEVSEQSADCFSMENSAYKLEYGTGDNANNLVVAYSHEHTWSDEWTSNETHHWHECTADGCEVTEDSQKNGYGEHDYTGDYTCDCGLHTHDNITFDKEWTAASGELKSGNYYLTESNATALTDNITIPENATVNLCLNGKTLDMGSHYIINDGTLTICDCQETQGSIISTSYGIRNNGGTLTVTGGTVSSTGTSGKGIYNSGENTVTVSGGLVTGDTGIYNASTGTVTISGGNVNSKSSSAVYNYGKGSIVISGGTVKSESSFAIYNQKSGSIKVSGGEVISESIDAIRNASTANVEISGTAVVFGKRTGIYNAGGVITVTGGQVKANTEYGIWNYLGSVTISGGTVSTESLIGIYNESTGSVTVSDGTVIGSVAVYNYSGGSAEISGGTLTGTEYGVYNSGNGAIYLSGNPEISGSDDVYLNKGKLYAHANGDINDAYEGDPLTVKIRSSFTDGVVVYEINDDNEKKFSLSEGSTPTLVRVGDNLIVDSTAPTGEIVIGTNRWNTFLNTITFGLFFKETQSVTITADDNLSGVKEIAYYLATGEMSKEQLDALQSTDWTVDDEFNINPENKYIIYAKITDNAGNVTYISTNGVVLFKDTEVTTGEYEYTLTTKTDIVTNIKPGNNTVASIDIEEPGGGAGNSLDYFVNTEGYIVLKGESLEAFTKDWYAGDYTVTVMYNALGEAYGDGTSKGDKITDTVLTLTVKRFKVEKPAADSTVFTYNGSEQTYNVAESEYYIVTGNKRTNAGEQQVVVALKDTNTFEWADGTTDNLTFKFNIGKEKVTPPTIDGKVYTGETLTADVSDTALYTVTTNAGGKNVAAYDVVLTLKDGANYKWDAVNGVDGNKITLKFQISQAANEWTENPAMAGWTYGETVKAPTGKAKFIEGDYGIAYYDKDKNPIGNPSDAGDYFAQIFVAATDNFTGLTSEYLPFTIKKAPLTITANPHTITYGDAPTNDGVEYSGFVNGEGEYVLEGTLGFDYSYAQYDDIGDNFTITPKGLTAANYEITFVPGKLTVNPLKIDFDWETLSPEDLVYDGNDKEIGTTVKNQVTSGQYDLWLLVEYHGDTKNVTEEGFYAQIKGPAGEKAYNYDVDTSAKSPVYKITKATPETNFPTGFNIDTDKKLSDIDLTGFDGYTWDAPDTVVEYDTHEYAMTFTPADTQNYVTVSKMIKVAGGDITAPTGEITLKDNKWTEFLNNITFGLFFKETQSITITAADTESGVKEIAYYLATEELSIDDIKALENSKWTFYTDAFNVEPDNKYVVYARITDNAGNVIYINSDGIVLDSIKPVIAGVEDGKDVYGDATFTVDEVYLDTVTLDGEPIEVKDGKYSVPADNEEHTIVVTDKTGNAVTYKLTVFKNYKVSFVVDGKEIEVSEIGYGKDATLPEIPAKDGYTAKWDVDGKNITADTVITVVYEKIPQSPQTGDNTNIWLWIAVMFVSGLSIFGIVITKKRKEEEAE